MCQTHDFFIRFVWDPRAGIPCFLEVCSKHSQHSYLKFSNCHTRAPSWTLSKAENLASSSSQDGATKWYYCLQEPTRPDPTTQFSFSFNVVRCPHPNSPPINKLSSVPPPSKKFFPTLIVPPIKKVCAVSPRELIL